MPRFRGEFGAGSASGGPIAVETRMLFGGPRSIQQRAPARRLAHSRTLGSRSPGSPRTRRAADAQTGHGAHHPERRRAACRGRGPGGLRTARQPAALAMRQLRRSGRAWLTQRCPRCGAQARPDVVMFGGMLNEELLTRAQEVAAQSDVFLVVGTSAAVYPAADLPTIETRRVPRSSRST